MDERAAFVAAIRADPTAALPRLQFADFLDEQGETDAAEWLRLDTEEWEAWCGRRLDRWRATAANDRLQSLYIAGLPRRWPVEGVPAMMISCALAGWVR